MKIEKPEDVLVTMTITMKASEWEALRDQLQDKWPSWTLSSAITDLFSQTRKILWRDETAEPTI